MCSRFPFREVRPIDQQPRKAFSPNTAHAENDDVSNHTFSVTWRTQTSLESGNSSRCDIDLVENVGEQFRMTSIKETRMQTTEASGTSS